MKSLKKGRVLERAVHLIQEEILRWDAKLAGTRFSIESNKTVTVCGVRHEIDVLVQTLPGSAYQSTVIFECKDWKKPVGKNDVIILAEKVEALRANRGFLVARALTKDAKAQLESDKRLAFVQCADEFLSPFNDLQLVRTSYDLLPIQISIKERAAPPKLTPEPLDWKRAMCRLDGQPTTITELVNKHVDELVLQKDSETKVKHLQAGTHFDKRVVLLVFDQGELTIDGMEIEHLAIEVQFFITVERQKILSKFELKGQGRCFSFAPIPDPVRGTSLEIEVVHRI